MKYKVIKDIPEGWETNASVGDILIVGRFEGYFALMKDGKAVCDTESTYHLEHCEPIESGESQ